MARHSGGRVLPTGALSELSSKNQGKGAIKRRRPSMSRRMVSLIAPLLMATHAFICFAQVEQGAISGQILDSGGASIPSAKITATNQATGTIARTETTPEGY